MHLFDLTLPTPEENLAIDEALLDEAEEAAGPYECLRLWEAARPLVVVGRNSRLADEVNVDACRAAGVPILRRTSGGCAIVAGPGSLMYAVVLSYERRPALKMLDTAHRFVLETIADALRAAGRKHRTPWHQRPGAWGTEVLRQQRSLPPASVCLSRHAAVRLSAGVGR